MSNGTKWSTWTRNKRSQKIIIWLLSSWVHAHGNRGSTTKTKEKSDSLLIESNGWRFNNQVIRQALSYPSKLKWVTLKNIVHENVEKEKYIEFVNNFENNTFLNFCIPLESVKAIYGKQSACDAPLDETRVSRPQNSAGVELASRTCEWHVCCERSVLGFRPLNRRRESVSKGSDHPC